MIEANIATIG